MDVCIDIKLEPVQLPVMASKSQQLQVRLTPEQKKRLKRLATAAGQDVSSYVLSRVLPPSQKRFEELLTLLSEGEDTRYVLASLNDLLSELGPGELRPALAHAEVGRLSPFLGNYVAAMVEQACYLNGLPPPPWTATVAPLDRPHFAAPWPGLRLHLLKAAPVPFKRRNLFVDAAVGSRV
ncbi:MAG: DUF1778 domain-containing protein [Gemmatimonadales bacterium]|nr:MAG: DUF1778 domain-containing protein [Gemmatimonadales bacterium]